MLRFRLGDVLDATITAADLLGSATATVSAADGKVFAIFTDIIATVDIHCDVQHRARGAFGQRDNLNIDAIDKL